MPIPTSSDFKIYPSNFINIVSGEYDVGASSVPITQQPLASRETIAAYYASEVSDAATCPKLRRVELGGVDPQYTVAAGDYETQAFLKSTIIFDVAGTPTPISVLSADFPLGVRFNQMQVFIGGGGLFLWQQGDRQVSNIQLKARGSTVLNVNPSSNVTFYESSSSAIVPFSQHWGTTQLLGTTIGHKFTVITIVGAGGVSLYNPFQQFYIRGIYNSGWINLSVLPTNANPGDTIVITDTLSNMPIFSDFKVYWKANSDATELVGGVIIPRTYWTKTNTTVTIKIPTDLGIPYGQRIFRIYGVVTSSSWPIPTGSPNNEIELARINDTPILTDGSGIYNLTPNKRNDTYYDRASDPSALTNLKIPNPYVKTGFFNG